jgi:hypothetical protein
MESSAHRRGRKSPGLLELALDGHWSVAAFLASMTALAGMFIVPVLCRSSSALMSLSATLKPVVWSLCGFFALTALIKFRLEMRAESRQRLQEYLARDDASLPHAERSTLRREDDGA